MTAYCQEVTLFVARYSLFVKSEKHKITNGHVASTVFLFFTNDERRITNHVSFDSTADIAGMLCQPVKPLIHVDDNQLFFLLMA